MITSQFILFFFAFLVICFLVIGLINWDLRDKRYLSTMGCLMSVMLIVCVCFFPFPYQDELLETMIADGEGLANNFIPFHTIISIFCVTSFLGIFFCLSLLVFRFIAILKRIKSLLECYVLLLL